MQRLDIKIVLEAEDFDTNDHVHSYDLPGHFEIIIVPRFRPQTKPKALNYALCFARGSLVTVFDAEDIPHPCQLRRAAEIFATASSKLACLQARLGFFNCDGWLTAQFALEYGLLFRRLLPTLAALGLPFPLGGTSNHLRISALRQVGAWDAYNVTEDADLGFRLARAGYKLDVFDSVTAEEAAGELGDWLPQRARWLKGWMQTWVVHMRHPGRTLRELGWDGFLVFQVWLGGMILSALAHPLFLAYTIWIFGAGQFFPLKEDGFSIVSTGLSLAVLAAGYGVLAVAAIDLSRDMRLHRLPLILLSLPLYWLLISAAAWLALWQFARQPFAWNKTRHGRSFPPSIPGNPTSANRVVALPSTLRRQANPEQSRRVSSVAKSPQWISGSDTGSALSRKSKSQPRSAWDE